MLWRHLPRLRSEHECDSLEGDCDFDAPPGSDRARQGRSHETRWTSAANVLQIVLIGEHKHASAAFAVDCTQEVLQTLVELRYHPHNSFPPIALIVNICYCM